VHTSAPCNAKQYFHKKYPIYIVATFFFAFFKYQNEVSCEGSIQNMVQKGNPQIFTQRTQMFGGQFLAFLNFKLSTYWPI
jgi:hypothetical protein